MSRLIVGLIVGAVAALAVGAASQPVMRERLQRLAETSRDGGAKAMRIEDATDFVKRMIQTVGQRTRQAAAESRIAAAEERERLWKQFEHARDAGRADIEVGNR